MVADVICLIWTGHPDIDECCLGNYGPPPAGDTQECNTDACIPPVTEAVYFNVTSPVTDESDANTKQAEQTSSISHAVNIPPDALGASVVYKTDKKLSLLWGSQTTQDEQTSKVGNALFGSGMNSYEDTVSRRALSVCTSYILVSENFTAISSVMNPATFLVFLETSLNETVSITDCGSSGILNMEVFYTASSFGDNSTEIELAVNAAVAVLENSGYTIVLTNASVSSHEDHCPSDWYKTEDKCYQYEETTRDWTRAQGICNNRGAILIELVEVIQNTVAGILCPDGESCWLGGGLSSWTSSAFYSYTNFDIQSNIAVGDHNKLSMTHHKTWQYLPNTTYLPFICMKSTIGYGAWAEWTSCTEDCGSGWKSRSRTCSTGRQSDCASITSVFSIDYFSCNAQTCTSSTSSTDTPVIVWGDGETKDYDFGNDNCAVIRLEGVQNQYGSVHFTVTPIGVMINTRISLYINDELGWTTTFYGVMSASRITVASVQRYMFTNEFTVCVNNTLTPELPTFNHNFQVIINRMEVLRQEAIALQCASATDAHLLEWPTILDISQIGFRFSPSILHLELQFPRKFFNISIAFNGTGMCDFDENRVYVSSPTGLNETYWRADSIPSSICDDVTYESDIPWEVFNEGAGGGTQQLDYYANTTHIGFIVTVKAKEMVSTSLESPYNETFGAVARTWTQARASTWRYPLLVTFQRKVSFSTTADVFICGGSSSCTIIHISALIAYKRKSHSLYEFDIVTKTQYPYVLDTSVIPEVYFVPDGHASPVAVNVSFVSESGCSFADTVDLSGSNVPACTQYWKLSAHPIYTACSISGAYVVTWTATCFYGKPICYFARKHGVVFNTQTASFHIKSENMCPDVVHDIDLAGSMCDTGALNFDNCLLNSRFDSGIDVYFRTSVSSTLGAINFTRIVGVSVQFDYSSVLALPAADRPLYDRTFENGVIFDAFNPGPVSFSDELGRHDTTIPNLVQVYDSVATGSPVSAAFKMRLHNYLIPVLFDGLEVLTVSATVEVHYEGVALRRRLQVAQQDLMLDHMIDLGQAMRCAGLILGQQLEDRIVELTIEVRPSNGDLSSLVSNLILIMYDFFPPTHIQFESELSDDSSVLGRFSVIQDSSFALTLSLLYELVDAVNSEERTFCIQSTQINKFSRAVMPGALVAIDRNSVPIMTAFVAVAFSLLLL